MYDYLEKLKTEKKFMPSTVLDIGAWNGFWTTNVKKIWPEAEYTCIEAGPKHEQKLKQITRNYHITVLGDSHREVKMHLLQIKKGTKNKITYTKGSSIFGVYKNYELRQMRTLDEVVGINAQFDLIKQDVQGAEIMIMEGAPNIFKRAKYVIQEVNLHKDENFPEMPYEETMDKYMANLGFENNDIIATHDGFDQVDKIYY